MILFRIRGLNNRTGHGTGFLFDKVLQLFEESFPPIGLVQVPFLSRFLTVNFL